MLAALRQILSMLARLSSKSDPEHSDRVETGDECGSERYSIEDVLSPEEADGKYRVFCPEPAERWDPHKREPSQKHRRGGQPHRLCQPAHFVHETGFCDVQHPSCCKEKRGLEHSVAEKVK